MDGGIDAYCNLYEPYYRGRYESIDYRSVYTPTEEECEEKLEEPIREMNAEIEALSDEVRAELGRQGW